MKSFDELKSLIDQRGVHAVFGDYGEGWGIEQNSFELAVFLTICQELEVSSVLEIGTGYKAGLARFLHDDMGWQVTSVDIHDYGHQYGGITFLKLDTLPDPYPGIYDSFDLVIIDGDHSYEAVQADYGRWSELARKVVMFHDIAGLRDCEGVARYWQEIARAVGDENKRAPGHGGWHFKLTPGFHEIIADGDQRSGIGYLVISEFEQFLQAQFSVVELVEPTVKIPAAPRKPRAKKKAVARK